MVRTQIQLTEDQYRKLKKKAGAMGVSMAELIRSGVDHELSVQATPGDKELKARARELMGRFKSGTKDISRRHDEYLAEGIR